MLVRFLGTSGFADVLLIPFKKGGAESLNLGWSQPAKGGPAVRGSFGRGGATRSRSAVVWINGVETWSDLEADGKRASACNHALVLLEPTVKLNCIQKMSLLKSMFPSQRLG